MCSESFPKEFEKTTEVLPFTKYGLSSNKEFKEVERDIQELEWLKKAGLSTEEIKLYKDNEAGLLGQKTKVESNALKEKLETIYNKINNLPCNVDSSEGYAELPSTSNGIGSTFDKMKNLPLTFYPEGHPMNSIKQLEEKLFNHLKDDDMMAITKRRKILRRLQRKKDRILALENQIDIGTANSTAIIDRPDSLWDVKEMPRKQPKIKSEYTLIGPKKPTMYTIKGNKIVRLEPISTERKDYQAVDIVMPINQAEVQLLEGTKMSIDDIRKIERFKDYEPGVPSKTLYLKNIAPSVTQEQLSLMFKQFTLANAAPVDIRLMSGRMRGQAFVSFQNVDTAIQALEETNGTILSGRPVIAQFGRNSNRIDDHR